MLKPGQWQQSRYARKRKTPPPFQGLEQVKLVNAAMELMDKQEQGMLERGIMKRS